MEVTNEMLGAGAVGLLVVLGAVGNYLRTLRGGSNAVTTTPTHLGEPHQVDRIIAELKRIADALTDKNTAGINDRLENLADRLDKIGTRTQPRRRR